MAEEFSRKRSTRGGYRSTATRIITSAIKILATGDLPEIAKHAVKLNQQKASLQEKRTILQKLDMEILALVNEEEIETEIERADLVEENIQLAIANIDHALSSNANTNDAVANLPAQPIVPASTSTEEGPVRASNREWFLASKCFFGGFFSIYTEENTSQTTEVGTKEIRRRS